MGKEENKSFPWTFDQYQRYAVLREFLREFYFSSEEAGLKNYGSQSLNQKSLNKESEWTKNEGRTSSEEEREAQIKPKVLDVGGISPTKDGRSYWLPLSEIWDGFKVVVDLIFFPVKECLIIQADGLNLPFPDGSFEVVAALDVIEHIDKDKREIFVEELCRVSSDSVILSAPVACEENEAADLALFETVKAILKVEHRQLLEHLERGLPEKEDVSWMLKKRMPAGFELGYGSLISWLIWQTIRAPFFDYYKRQEILDLLDCFALSSSQPAEFRPPFSRYFWIYSRQIPLWRLEAGIRAIKERLVREEMGFSFEEALRLNRLIHEFWSKKGLSALVISEGDEAKLRLCLNHLLSQRIDESLEILVWVIKGELSPVFAQNFPGIKFIREEVLLTMNVFRSVINRLKGDWILLLHESILLPEETVLKLWKKATKGEEEPPVAKNFEDDPESMKDKFFLKCTNGVAARARKEEKGQLAGKIFCPRIIQGPRSYGVWCGRNFSPWKLMAGRRDNFFWNFSAEKCSWLYGECLFFPRGALFCRRGKEGKIGKREIFLWQAESHRLHFIYCPDIIVYQQ